jgi:uncharacterized damage-inducible protein DinB
VTSIDRIIDELRRAHDGDPWHGSSVMALLDGVSAAAAAARPVPGGHTIWELVLHMTTWRNEVARRVHRGVAEPLEAEDWPRMPDQPADAAWAAARQALVDAHANLLRAVTVLPPARLDDVLGDRRDPPSGTGVSYYVLLHGIAQHDAYHGGQIAMLKRAAVA